MSHDSLTSYGAAMADAADAAVYDAFTECTETASSAAHYLDTMAAEYSGQARQARTMAGNARRAGLHDAAATQDRQAAVTQAKADAYADALRVVTDAGEFYERRARRYRRDVGPLVGFVKAAG